MESYKIYIVEDMGVTRATLSSILNKNGHVVVGGSATAEKAWLDLKELAPDLVLLDLNLKGNKSGIWLAEKIREHLKVPFIFITAYGSNEILNKLTAIEPDGYIMKPFNNATLIANIQLAVSTFLKLNPAINRTSDSKKFHILKTKNGIQKIEMEDIYYVQSTGNYITIYLENRDLICRQKLDTFLYEINFTNMQKTHRRFAVNIKKITAIQKETVIIESVEIPVSKTYLENLENLFNESR